MFCIHCGAVLPEQAAFCPACGAKVPGHSGGSSEKSPVPAVCTACGSRNLKMVRRGEYLCEYCGARFFADGQDSAASEEETAAELLALFEEAADYERRDEISSELRVLLKGLDLAPENCSLLLKLGRAYWRLGSNDKAMEYFQKAEKLNPDNPIVYINIGNIYLTNGQYAAAKPLYEKGLAAIEADPTSLSANDIAVSYGNYGNCLGRMGDRAGAKKYLSIAKKKGYSRESLNNVCRQLGLHPWLL